MVKAIYLVLVIGAAGWAQKHENSRPDFKDFAVERMYTGAPAAPKLTTNWRMFRTAIRAGAKSPVEFAGHYTIPRWAAEPGAAHL